LTEILREHHNDATTVGEGKDNVKEAIEEATQLEWEKKESQTQKDSIGSEDTFT
jgi:hypothetical protein